MDNKELLKMYGTPIRNYHIKPPFIISSHDVYRDEILWNIMRGKTELYFYLRTWIIRGKMKYNDKLNLYQNYHKKGKLAAAVGVKKLAKDLKLGRDTVRQYLKTLEYFGIVDVDIISAKDSYDKQKHKVYIFGEHNMKEGKLNEEIYYIDIIL